MEAAESSTVRRKKEPPGGFDSRPQAGCGERPTLRARTKAMQRATKHFQAGDIEAFYKTLTVASFRKSPISVSLANPNLPDCPLVGVSQGFEQLTGFTRSEILGRNCRFLNYGCHMPAKVRHELRCTIRTHSRFVGILTNRRKNGEIFKNLLHLSSLRVGNSTYILGVQADVTNSDAKLEEESHMDELNEIVDAIFMSNVNAWVALQAANFGEAKLSATIPWYAESRLVPRYPPQLYREARDTFVSFGSPDSFSGTRLCYSNTFLEVRSEESPGERLTRLRMISSEPALGIKNAELLEGPRLQMQAFRDSLAHLRPGSSALPPRDALKHRTARATEVQPPEELGSPKSVGSAAHPNGCTPCSFHCYSKMGCNRGESCAYCHMDHPKRVRRRGNRKPKSRADSSTAAAADCDQQLSPFQSASVQEAGSPLCAQASLVNLMPLLGALELLAPLPDVRTELEPSLGSSAAGPPVDAFSAETPEPAEDWPALSGDDVDRGLNLLYSESTVVLVIGQWKQVLPFVRGAYGEEPVFSVDVPLPRGLMLHRTTGVISGRACQLTAPMGSFHIITMETDAGRAETAVHISVVDAAGASGVGSCSEAVVPPPVRWPGPLESTVSYISCSEEE